MTEEIEPLIENMEVHHHPDLHHSKKHFREYFLEFLMIFLAVSLGFISENIREHYSEHERAITLAKSLIQDLEADTSKLSWTIQRCMTTIKQNDTLLLELKKKPAELNTGFIQILSSKVSMPWYYLPFNGTYEQVKNSGSLRYFTTEVSRALTNYEQMSKQLDFAQDLERTQLRTVYLPMLFSALNSRYIDAAEEGQTIDIVPTFKRSDPHTLDDLYSFARFTKIMSGFLFRVYSSQHSEAEKNILLLKKEYDL